MPGWLVMNGYSLLIGIFLYYYSNKYSVKLVKQLKVFNSLIILLSVLLISDSLGRITADTPEELFLLKIGNLMIFILDPLIGYFIIKYIDSWTEQVSKLQRVFINIVEVIISGNAILIVLTNIFNLKWVYYFEDYEYMRGPLYVPRAIIILGLCILVETYVVLFRNYINKQYYKTIKYFPLIPLVFGILQIIIPGYAFEYTGMILTCIILFIYIQSKYLSVDHLTNLANRKIFDNVYNKKISEFYSKGKEFSLFMIDLDKFKNINDTYGHDVGDEALVNVTMILKESFNKRDVICRCGGDEFYILSDIKDNQEIQKVREKIQEKINAFNEISDSYKIGLSIGNVIYNSKKISSDEYLKMADQLMYEHKKSKKLDA